MGHHAVARRTGCQVDGAGCAVDAQTRRERVGTVCLTRLRNGGSSGGAEGSVARRGKRGVHIRCDLSCRQQTVVIAYFIYRAIREFTEGLVRTYADIGRIGRSQRSG